MMHAKRNRRRNAGMAAFSAILFLSVLAALAVVLFSTGSMNLAQASNQRAAHEARMAGESGVSFLTNRVQNCGVLGSLRGPALLNSLAAKMASHLNATANLGGASVSYDGSTISIPRIGLGDGRSFTGAITLPAYDRLRLTVTGQFVAGTGGSAATVQRQVALDFYPTWDQAIGFGLCSNGPVEMGMNTDLSGVTDPSDGSIYSATAGTAVTCGSGHISGDVSVSDPLATMSLGGTTVDGVIRYNVPPVTMPTINRTPYKSLATTVMNSPNPPAGTYKNIRIPANTNPTFGSSVTIQGVMHVEAPNKIYFNNNVDFTGIMVADDPPMGSPDSDNYIYFKNNMTFKGAEALPDTPEFAAVRKLKGASILCPGFEMEFKNNMDSVAGIMALKTLTAKNNLASTVLGSLLIYGSGGLDFKNNTDLNISLSGSSPPPGFVGYGKPPLEPEPDTYTEK